MKVIIDTSSILALVRYYLPFDKTSALIHFLKSKIEIGVIIIDKVLEECNYISKKIIIEKLDFLKDKTYLKSINVPYNTKSIIAPSPRRFLSQIDNNFVIGTEKNRLKKEEYEVQKYKFLESADLKQIIVALNFQQDSQNIAIVTEESKISNDKKPFKKIPAICEILKIPTMPLPEFFSIIDDIQIEIKES